jgi:hypothetical protein
LLPTSNSIPLDLTLAPGITPSFAAFRSYKERVPVVLRVPSASTRIFFASKTRKVTSRAHPGAYTRPHRTDPGDLPSQSVSIMAFEFCHDDATQESFFAFVSALFDCFNTENLRVIQLLTSYEFPPDGSYVHKMFSFAFFGNLKFRWVHDQRSRWE